MMKKNNTQDKIVYSKFLKKVPLFKGLNNDSISIINNICKKIIVPRNEYILKKNEKSNMLYIIVKGSVEIQEQNKDGKVKVLAILNETECFGEMGFLTNRLRSATVKTLKETVLLTVSRQKFFNMLVKNSKFMLNVVKILSERLVNTNNQIQTLVFKNLQGRVASALLRLSESYGVQVSTEGIKIDFPIKHSFIADLTGTSRETVTKILAQFKTEGSINIESKYITIIDKKKLLSWG